MKVLRVLKESFCFCLLPLSRNSDALLVLLFCPEQSQQCPRELLKSFTSIRSLIAFLFTNKTKICLLGLGLFKEHFPEILKPQNVAKIDIMTQWDFEFCFLE